MFQVSGLVQIFLQAAAAGVLPAELSAILVDGNGNGNGNAAGRDGNVGAEHATGSQKYRRTCINLLT